MVRTPVLRCAALEALLGNGTEVYAKLEFLQCTGTFKARGALATLRSLSEKQLKAGVTAVSAGNHAIATAFAAKSMGTSAKVVMIGSANPSRIASCRAYGGEVVLVDDAHEAFAVAERIQEEEGRYFVHPFEGPQIALGTGTVGMEICEQVSDFDVLIVPVGGGGLIGGISNAVKQLRPDCEIVGVEPEGADSMHRSRDAGAPTAIEKVKTIADSLGAPFAMPYSFALCEENVDRLVLVDDDQLRRAMGFLFRSMKIAVEPACAATTAALLGPLRDELQGKRIVLVMCGSNIDWATFEQQAILDDETA
ncbi:MAG: threonine/serine dehydratase [Gammaproteobacteria bacterium]|nr:threonine/serine dehydratase [Gammaproteobacteria bacterium]